MHRRTRSRHRSGESPGSNAAKRLGGERRSDCIGRIDKGSDGSAIAARGKRKQVGTARHASQGGGLDKVVACRAGCGHAIASISSSHEELASARRISLIEEFLGVEGTSEELDGFIEREPLH